MSLKLEKADLNTVSWFRAKCISMTCRVFFFSLASRSFETVRGFCSLWMKGDVVTGLLLVVVIVVVSCL